MTADAPAPPTFGGRPVAACVACTVARQRLVTEGIVTEADMRTWRGAPGYACVLDDGTGTVTLVFSGTRVGPGMVVGARCRVEGTALADPWHTMLVLWNPRYELLS